MFLTYLITINLLSGFCFCIDKQAAKNNHRRIPEARLHFLELMGGVFINWVLMYTIRHKNKKFSYSAVTYLFLLIWLIGILYGKYILINSLKIL